MSLQTAEQYEENEQYTQAYEEYKKLHEKNPKDLSILERLGHLSMLLDNKDITSRIARPALNVWNSMIQKTFENGRTYECSYYCWQSLIRIN